MVADTDTLSSADLLGKTASALQSITIGDNAISGTLNYVTGYTGFSGDVSEQEGNYLALHVTANGTGADVYVMLVGGVHGEVKLDDDMIIIIRVTSNTQSVRIRAVQGTTSLTKTYTLTELTLASS